MHPKQYIINYQSLFLFNFLLFIKENNAFGYTEFFTGMPRSHFAKTVTVTHLIYLDFNKFKEKLEDFPDDFVYFYFFIVYFRLHIIKFVIILIFIRIMNN